MKNDLLIQTIDNLQNEYLSILNKYSEVIDSSNVVFAINEIQIFWNSKRRIVYFFLMNYSNNFDTCVLTCSSYLNIERNNQYPFLAIADKHILDDPVVNFSQALNKSSQLNSFLLNIIKKSIKEDIEIIKNKDFNIYLMPITFLFSDLNMSMSAANKLFFTLFKTKNIDIKIYHEQNKNFNDIIQNLKNYIKQELFITDNTNESFEMRYKEYLKYSHFDSANLNEVDKFYVVTTGMFAQVFNIIGICIQFSLYPFIREDNILNNFCLQSSNFMNIQKMDSIIKLSIGHFILFNSFDFSRNSYPNLYLFLKNLKEHKFNENIVSFLLLQECPCNKKGSFSKIRDYIINKMEQCNFYLDNQDNI